MAELTSKASLPDCIFGKAGSKSCKSPLEGDAGTSPLCPQCGSKKVWRDGHRTPMFGQPIQRWSCRDCSYKFSDPVDVENARKAFQQAQTIESMKLKSTNDIATTCQICVDNDKETKNLDTQAEMKTVCAGEIDQTQQGLIFDFQWKMKKRNKALSTIQNRTLYLTRIVKLGADLRNPETVETVFCTEEWTDATKYNAVKAYKAFTKAFKIEWEPLETHYEPKEPFYPQEEEIDLLINACSKVTATFLQVAKDTGARVGEIRKIEWTDIDDKNNTIAINHPEKGSKARTVKVPEKTIAMVKNLKKNHGKHVFNPLFVSQRKTFNRTREKMARITGNPRLLQIHFHTCRHWRASREFERTGDIYEVKKLTGHKCVSNTDRYQHGSYSNAEYVTKRPQTPKEEDELITAGFEFVRFDQALNVPIYRKRK